MSQAVQNGPGPMEGPSSATSSSSAKVQESVTGPACFSYHTTFSLLYPLHPPPASMVRFTQSSRVLFISGRWKPWVRTLTWENKCRWRRCRECLGREYKWWKKSEGWVFQSQESQTRGDLPSKRQIFWVLHGGKKARDHRGSLSAGIWRMWRDALQWVWSFSYAKWQSPRHLLHNVVLIVNSNVLYSNYCNLLGG